MSRLIVILTSRSARGPCSGLDKVRSFQPGQTLGYQLGACLGEGRTTRKCRH